MFEDEEKEYYYEDESEEESIPVHVPIALGQINPEGMKEYLTKHNWPYGLQEATLKSLYNIPKRYFIVGKYICLTHTHSLYLCTCK